MAKDRGSSGVGVQAGWVGLGGVLRKGGCLLTQHRSLGASRPLAVGARADTCRTYSTARMLVHGEASERRKTCVTLTTLDKVAHVAAPRAHTSQLRLRPAAA
jgi:hypothetical protein